jgi:hypothetical protein
MIAFFDETGISPFPPGVKVTVVDDSTLVGVGYTTVGGLVSLSLTSGQTYAASFVGTQAADAQPVVFVATGGTTSVTVPGYRSPALSAYGYAEAQMDELSPEDYPQSARLWGGIAYALGYAFGSGMASTDLGTQQVLAACRLQSCTGSMIDSWANDYIGAGVWSRGAQETDAAYIARIELWFATRKTTLYGIQTLLQAFIIAQANVSALTAPMALDVSGALDESGALDGGTITNVSQLLPTISCFDYQSNANLSEQVGLVRDEGQFAILFSFPNASLLKQWFLGQSFLNENAFLLTNQFQQIAVPSPAIGQLVKRIKLPGTNPIYVSNSA